MFHDRYYLFNACPAAKTDRNLTKIPLFGNIGYIGESERCLCCFALADLQYSHLNLQLSSTWSLALLALVPFLHSPSPSLPLSLILSYSSSSCFSTSTPHGPHGRPELLLFRCACAAAKLENIPQIVTKISIKEYTNHQALFYMLIYVDVKMRELKMNKGTNGHLTLLNR